MARRRFKFNLGARALTLAVKYIKLLIIIIVAVFLWIVIPWGVIGCAFDNMSSFSIKTVLMSGENPALDYLKAKVKPYSLMQLNIPALSYVDESQMVNLMAGKGQYEYFFAGEDENTVISNDSIGKSQQETKPVLAVNVRPKAGEGYIVWSKAYIKNTSKQKPNVDSLMREELKLNLKSASSGPQVLILHTHATEAFNEAGDVYYPSVSPSSTDNSKNIVRVGEEMVKTFEENGIKVIHSTTQHDNPAYKGSYDRSHETADYYLDKYPSIKVVLDIHRDTIENDAGVRYRPIVEINGKKAAQVMILCGVGTSASPNSHWKENLKFGITLQEKLETNFEGLTRPLLMRDARYNSHVSNGALLIEVGTDGNTLEEAILGGQYTAKALSEIIKNQI